MFLPSITFYWIIEEKKVIMYSRAMQTLFPDFSCRTGYDRLVMKPTTGNRG